MMKLSIVTISYNQGKYLIECIRSVLDQDYDDFEYIIVDPGSSDGSREVIDSFHDQRIKRIYEPDSGPADGLNKGFACARGEIYGFINADDLYLPGAFKQVVNSFSRHKNVDIISGNGYLINAESEIIRHIISTRFSLRGYFHGGVNIIQQATFFRAPIYKKVGGFNIDNKWYWDGELFVRMAANGAIFERVANDWASFRIHESSISGGQGNRMEYLQAREDLKGELLGIQSNALLTSLYTGYYKTLKWLQNPMHVLGGVITKVK